MKVLENLSVDEYYQTITTWMKIIEEKNKSVERGSDQDDEKPVTRKKMSSKK